MDDSELESSFENWANPIRIGSILRLFIRIYICHWLSYAVICQTKTCQNHKIYSIASENLAHFAQSDFRSIFNLDKKRTC